MIEKIDELDDFFLSYMPVGGSTGAIRDCRLDRMVRLLREFGNPEESLKLYHLAGSKGKGTTAEMLSVLLEADGHRTGLFMSPHVYDLRERFTLSGRFFQDDEYIKAANILEKGLEDSTLDFRPTTFELYTLYAYILFRETGCEYAVIETGMGGRLDATNTITPIASILMPIELEHTNVLGSTIAEIAAEKSKIIKPHRPVYMAVNSEEAEEVFISEALQNKSPIHPARLEIENFQHIENRDGNFLSFDIDGDHYELKPRLHSDAIAQNMALSILIAKREGFLTEKGIKALEDLVMPGRFEERTIGGRKVILEVAHTARSVENALESFERIYGRNPDYTCIFGAVEGKDYQSMTDEILRVFDNLIISSPGTFKKTNIEEIYAYARKRGGIHRKTTLMENAGDALRFALRSSEVILIIGSFYLVGQFGELNA